RAARVCFCSERGSHPRRRRRHHVGCRCARKVCRRRAARPALHRTDLPRAGPRLRMRIGVPREVKDGEFRVALTPAAVLQLTNVVVEPGAGVGVGFSDADYVAADATLGNAWDCELIVKVKELQPPEYRKPRRGQTLFSFQHFAPEPSLLDAALASGATFIAYETVGQEGGRLPILAPMSAIAGRLAVQVGAWCLQKQNGGSGALLPGLDGVPPGKVVILGAGNVGANALAVAHGIGASVTVFAKTDRRFPPLRAKYPHARFS